MFSSVTILVSTKLTTVTPSMVSRRRWRREACDIGQTPVQDRNRTLTGSGRRGMLSAGPRAGLTGVESDHNGPPDRGRKRTDTLHLPQYGAESRVHLPITRVAFTWRTWR